MMMVTAVTQRFALATTSMIALAVGGCTAPLPQIGESTFSPDQAATPRGSGEHQINVRASEIRNSDFDALFAEANRRAAKRCPGEYYITRSSTYLGGEATSRFMGISEPWVQMYVRCSVVVRGRVTGVSAQILQELTQDVQDANFFDVHSENLNESYERAYEVVRRVLIQQGDAIWNADMKKGYIVTGRSPHPVGLFRFTIYEQYYVAMEPVTDSSTRITFKLFSYYVPEGGGLRPHRREFVYRRAGEFLQRVRSQLGP